MLILGLDQIAVPFSQGYLLPGLPAPIVIG